MIFDITTKESAMQTLCQFTGISANKIISFLEKNTHINEYGSVDTMDVSAEKLLFENNTSFGSLDVESLNLKVIHYTSNNDNCAAIQKLGLGDLQFALTEDTPLKRFLENNSIVIHPATYTLVYNGTQFDITYKTEGFDKSATHKIAHKIYFDNQLNGFFKNSNIERYGARVNKRPEFLYNIDDCFKLNLSYAWEKECTAYRVTYLAPVSDFALFTFYDTNRCEDFDEQIVAERLIQKALGVVSLADYDEIFAYMKPTTIIKPNQIESIIPL